MHSLVFYLGLWNPAGASRKSFKTREERAESALDYSRNGYITWAAGEETVPTSTDSEE